MIFLEVLASGLGNLVPIKDAVVYRYLTGRRLVSLVGKVSVYRARGSGSIPGRTNTRGFKIIEEEVLPFL